MFFKKKRSEVPAVLPKHISFIIDGNGRWAKKRGMKRTYGHKAGFEAVKKTVDLVEEYKIPYLCQWIKDLELNKNRLKLQKIAQLLV